MFHYCLFWLVACCFAALSVAVAGREALKSLP